MPGSCGLHGFDVMRRMHPCQLLERSKRCIMALKEGQQSGSDQLIFDGAQSRRRFWMIRPHVVLEAIRMGDITSMQLSHLKSCRQLKWKI